MTRHTQAKYEIALRHWNMGRACLLRQEHIVRELAAHNHPTDLALQVLATLERTQRLFQAEIEELASALGVSPHDDSLIYTRVPNRPAMAHEYLIFLCRNNECGHKMVVDGDQFKRLSVVKCPVCGIAAVYNSDGAISRSVNHDVARRFAEQ